MIQSTAAAVDNGVDVVGVAPGARVFSFKVCDEIFDSNGVRLGIGCWRTDIIAALDYIVSNYKEQIDSINVSITGKWGGCCSRCTVCLTRRAKARNFKTYLQFKGTQDTTAYATAFQNVYNAKIPIAVAAGNNGHDGMCCSWSMLACVCCCIMLICVICFVLNSNSFQQCPSQIQLGHDSGCSRLHKNGWNCSCERNQQLWGFCGYLGPWAKYFGK